MVGLALLVAASLSPIVGENLLSNPSFEERTPDGRPRAWSSYVMPQPGAFADRDPLAFGGSESIMLHTPEPYAQEPANNWSQVIVADLRGKSLEFSGYARTEAAGEAALWIQCFQQRPARVVAAQTSAINGALTGTSDWTRLTVSVDAPATTDFVVVRCILKGRGTAWFDELRLDVVATETPDLDEVTPVEASTDIPPPAPEPGGDLQVEDILELSKTLQRAVADLEQTNTRILSRVQQLQSDLDQSRTALDATAGRTYGAHPLVPHGYTPDGAPK